MDAGRELDALVAENVMGFVWVVFSSDGQFQFLVPPDWSDRIFKTSVALLLSAPDSKRIKKPLFRFIPKFSTDLAAAWTILEYLNRPEADHQTWVRLHDRIGYLHGLSASDVAEYICNVAYFAVREQWPQPTT